jgi:hypothetical protein
VLEAEGDVECDVRLRHGTLLTVLGENTLSLGALTRHASPHPPAMPQFTHQRLAACLGQVAD